MSRYPLIAPFDVVDDACGIVRTPDVVEQGERRAEHRLDAMTSGLPAGKFRCACGALADLAGAVPATADPWGDPACGPECPALAPKVRLCWECGHELGSRTEYCANCVEATR